MIINDENVAWAVGKLSMFEGWRAFPKDTNILMDRARSFLRLVHNRTAKEIMEDACRPPRIRRDDGTVETLSVDIDWSKKGIGPDENDADWILRIVQEEMEFFPLPVEMRRIYIERGKIPPATATLGDAGVRPADSEDGDV